MSTQQQTGIAFAGACTAFAGAVLRAIADAFHLHHKDGISGIAVAGVVLFLYSFIHRDVGTKPKEEIDERRSSRTGTT